jgi:GWxTD domain-containing protein
MRYSRLLLILLSLSLGFSASYSSSSSPSDKPKNTSKKGSQDGDRTQYYKKWLEEDVAYIISDEERSVFKKLTSDDERESFIQQFWDRRNPDPRSHDNAFKEEHYRRIAYADQSFASGIPGRKTDRGRIYIMFGKPDELESHPTGGQYDRPMNEGGGTTTTYPFEKWWYRHIEGIGDDIEIEFVDPSFTGEYRMAMTPDEKDALINVPNAGLTMAEQMGLADKRDRPYYNPSAWNDPNNAQNMFMRAKDSPFSRMEQYFAVQRPPKIKFEDLKSVVTTHVSYNSFPYDVRTDYIKLSSDKVLMPITIEISNKNLEFKKEMNFNRAVVNVYGIVTSLTNRIIAEFEDEIGIEYTDEYFEQGKSARSEYQKIVALPPGQRYKLDLVLKDVNSKNVGAYQLGLTIPKYDDASLQASTIILANSIKPAPTTSNQLEQYVIGDLKILPNVKSEYNPDQNLIPYLQVYNAAIDQTSLKPSLEVNFSVKKAGKLVEELQDNSGKCVQLVSGQRVVLLKQIPLKGIAPGKYTLEVNITDSILNNTVSTSTNFVVKEPVVQAISSAQPKS